MKLWQALTLVTLLWAGLYLPYLGSNEIRGEEARRILPARNMLTSGDWVVPTHGGRVYNRKPPFIYWNIASTFALTGVQNDWTARLPSVLWILAFALTSVLALRKRFGPWRAASVALFFLTAFGVLDKGRMAEIEAMYVAQTGIAFLLWANWWAEGKRWLAWTIPWFVLGLGLLSKGPVHLAFIYPIVIVALWRAKSLKDLIHPAHLLGIVLMLAVFLPWMFLNLAQVGSAKESSGVWTQQILERFNLSGFNFGKWILQPVLLAKDYLPWTVPLIWVWWKTRGTIDFDNRWDCIIAGSKIGILFGIVILMLGPEILPRYIMPLFPVASLLLVDLLGRVETDRLNQRWSFINAVAAILLAAVSLAAIWAIPQFADISVNWLGIFVGLIAGGLFFLRNRTEPLIITSLLFISGSILALSHLGPISAKGERYRPAAAKLSPLVPDESKPLVIYDPGDLRFLFYLNRPYQQVYLASQLRDLTNSQPPGYLLIQPEDFAEKKIQKVLKPFDCTSRGIIAAGESKGKPLEWELWEVSAKNAN